PPCSSLFPYTTLFRSFSVGCLARCGEAEPDRLSLRRDGAVAEPSSSALATWRAVHPGERPIVVPVVQRVRARTALHPPGARDRQDRKSTRLNSSHVSI